MKGKLSVVTWRDAHFYTDEPNRYPKEYLVRTAGWVSKDGRFLRIVGERTPDGARAVTRVPRAMVVKVERVGQSRSSYARTHHETKGTR